jgi:hypothetical protein
MKKTILLLCTILISSNFLIAKKHHYVTFNIDTKPEIIILNSSANISRIESFRNSACAATLATIASHIFGDLNKDLGALIFSLGSAFAIGYKNDDPHKKMQLFGSIAGWAIISSLIHSITDKHC